jgi:hypothetical protein
MHARLDPDSERTMKMMEGYVEHAFESEGLQFRQVVVYIRRTKDEPPFQGNA